jgi:hypothetical protein
MHVEIRSQLLFSHMYDAQQDFNTHTTIYFASQSQPHWGRISFTHTISVIIRPTKGKRKRNYRRKKVCSSISFIIVYFESHNCTLVFTIVYRHCDNNLVDISVSYWVSVFLVVYFPLAAPSWLIKILLSCHLYGY